MTAHAPCRSQSEAPVIGRQTVNRLDANRGAHLARIMLAMGHPHLPSTPNRLDHIDAGRMKRYPHAVLFPGFPWGPREHLAEARQLRSSTAASSQGAPLDITEQTKCDNRCRRTGRDRLSLHARHRSGSRWKPRARSGKFARSKSGVPPFANFTQVAGARKPHLIG